MHSQQHPDPEQLDKLRAGLLDDQPAVKSALESHIGHCPSCQSLMNSWQQLGPTALGPQLAPESLGHSLRQARQQALRATGKGHSRTFMPYATAALLLIAVSIGIWTLQPDNGVQQQMAVQDSRMIPDIYEDLDFYLWLANQKDNGNGDEKGNPNNT